MRKLVWFVHTSLDGFVARANGAMNWIKVDDELFEYAGNQTDQSDTAIYGRVTFDMMENYWPTAGTEPDASKHDKQHSEWYNNVEKIVFSNSLSNIKSPNTKVIGNNIYEEIIQLKQKPGKDILMLGSPSAAHFLLEKNLIDVFWLFVNPVLLGSGIPLFKGIKDDINLKLISSNVFSSNVIALHYEKV